MSTEYAVKMELLRRNREELTAKRLEIERRIALREATAAEYSAVALQSCKQQWKTLRANAIAAKKKNDEFIREVHDTQRKIDETYVRTTQKLWPSDNQLELEKARYLRKVEELYPAWQEKMQAMRVQTLRELEAKKRAIEQRRFLAKKTFETEQTLEDLIRRTTHEIELAENLEKNEAFERDVLRNQGEIQAMRIDESIRDHALGARMYMKQQAENQLDEAQHLQSDVEGADNCQLDPRLLTLAVFALEKIFETFSPRGAVNAMKQSNRSVNLVETSNNNAEERHVRPLRAQNILVPEPQYRYEELDSKQQQMEPFAKMKPAVKNSAPVETPINDAYAWARSDLRSRERLNTVQPTLTSTHDNFDSASLAITASPIHPHESDSLSRQEEALNKRAPNLTPSFSGTMWPLDRGIAVRDGQGQITSAPFGSYQPPTQLLPSSLSHQMEQSTRTQDIPTPLDSKHQFSTLVAEAMVSKTFDRPHQDHSQIQSQMDSIKNDHQDFQLRPQTTANGPDPPNDLKHEPMEDAKYVFNLSQPCQDEYKDETKASLTENRPESNRSDSDIANSDIVAEVKVLQFKELPAQEKIIEPIAEDDLPESIEAVLINSSSPPPHEEEEEAKNDSAPYHDLTLDFNSFDSNQSSMMDFSIGKLLESSVKADTLDGSTPILFCQEDTTATGLSEGPTQPSSGLETADQVVVPPDPSFVHDADHVTIQGVKEATHTQFTHLARDKSIEFSSVDSLSGLDSQGLEVEGVLESLRGTECPTLENPSENQTIPLVEDLEVTIESPPLSPEDGARETSIFAMLTMADRLKALNALISRVEEGINDGDQISCGMESGSSQETTRELLRMAVSGRKAQINFFGTDVCFELIAQLAKDLGPVLFPAKAFEGIMNDQKMKKVHHNAKEKEFDMWKAFAAHIKQVHAARAVPAGALVDMFTNAFLSHDPNNQRSQRKLREYLLSVCGATEATPKKDLTPSPPRQTTSPPIEPSSLANSTEVPSSPQMPSLLQTAFLQQSSPAKPKVYGIASSGFKKKLASDDVLKSMASSPTKLSQKLIRGGKMGDYSEFEEEEEVNLENLIGSKASSASTASKAASAFRSGGGNSMARMETAKEDKDDFDFDF